MPAAAAKKHKIDLDVAKLPCANRGFVLLPRRLVIERTFAWATRFRRLARASRVAMNHTPWSSTARRSHRWRLALIGAFCAATALGMAACVLRVAWIYQRSGQSGVLSVSITVQHGSCVIEWLRGPSLPLGRQSRAWIFNRQLDVGFRPRFSVDRRLGRTRLEIPVTLSLLALPVVAAGAIAVRRLWTPLPAGTCRCGYPLTGLGGTVPRCPECGQAIDPVSR